MLPIFGAKINQYYAVVCANFLAIAYGISVGWPSVSLPLLRSAASPLASGPISLLEASWIGSLLYIGGLFGTLFFGWFVHKFGRKSTLYFTAFPVSIGWLLIEFGQHVYLLFLARFLCGFSASAVFITVPLICSEISDTENRGTLSALMVLFMNIGILISYVACAYTSYETVPCIAIGCIMIVLIGYSIVPETPKYLLECGKTEAALESLKHFKGNPHATVETLQKYSTNLGCSKVNENNWKLKDFCEPATKKAIYIGLILMHVSVFSGPFTLANYYATIFQEAGSTLIPEVASIIVAVIQVVGNCIAVISIEKVGRKRLIVTSGYLATLCLTTVGIYMFLKEKGLDMSAVKTLPLIFLSLLMFVCANGTIPMPFVIIGEIFKQNVRGTLISFAMLFNWTALSVAVLTFPYMLLYLKLYGTMWLFSTVEICLITALVILLPETKGLSIEQIVTKLDKK